MMTKHSAIPKNYNGTSLIEVIVSIVILGIISLAFFGIFNAVLKFSLTKRIQIEASILATKQMEIVRNMPYNVIGVVSGIPQGTIPQTQTITRAHIPFTLTADVRYVDDPYDDVSPIDLLPTDYKQVKFTISWNTRLGSDSLFFLTLVAPKGVENTSGGGILKITVFDANGIPIPQALVDVVNPSETINLINVLSDNNGVVLYPGAPESVNGYQVTVDKTGFSASRTYGVNDPAGNAVPNPAHLSVFVESTTDKSFSIDRLSALTIITNASSTEVSQPIGLPFSIQGSKTIGQTTQNPPQPIYKYTNALSTDGVSGQFTINGLEWDTYTITFNEQAIGHNIVSYNPPQHPIILSPNSPASIIFTFQAPYSQYSLLLTLTDENGTPLAAADAHLTGESGQYDRIVATEQTGQVFFGNLAGQTYTLVITYPAYNPINTNVTINGNEEQKLQIFP